MNTETGKSILVIANCRLGDSLVMIPSLQALRKHFGDGTRIVLASEAGGGGFVGAKEILQGRGLVDEFVPMDCSGSWLNRAWKRLRLFIYLRRWHWDLGIVLMPPYPPLTMRLVERFRLYLRASGCRKILAPESIMPMRRDASGELERMESVVDAMMALLAPLGIPAPVAGDADFALPKSVDHFPADIPSGRYLAVAPAANMRAKCWPVKKYSAVLQKLRQAYPEITPIIFGGENEREICETLNEGIDGIVMVGRPLLEVEAVMRRCELYLGNDTGLMHLAASVGIRCLVIFSLRLSPGMWEPYGNGHCVMLAKGIDCSGCLAETCPKPHHPCMEKISPEEVWEKLSEMLQDA